MNKSVVDQRCSRLDASGQTTGSPNDTKSDLSMLKSTSSFGEADASSPAQTTPGVDVKLTALRDDVLLDVKYLKDVYHGLNDDTDGVCQ